tara:strand:- start:146 stop:562 length:417 start_codon:yes stop_codon:yes gene_type:complete
MKIPTLNHELSLLQSWWNSSSSINWFSSLYTGDQYIVLFILVLVIGIFVTCIHDIKVNGGFVWLINLPVRITISTTTSLYMLRCWYDVTFKSDFNLLISGVLGLVAALIAGSIMVMVSITYAKFEINMLGFKKDSNLL